MLLKRTHQTISRIRRKPRRKTQAQRDLGKAHFDQQCDFLTTMITDAGKDEIERLREEYEDEEERGDHDVRFVRLVRTRDGAGGDWVFAVG